MFSYQLDSDTTLELLAPRHAQELYRVVDENRDHLRPWLGWVEETKSVSDVQGFIRAVQTQVGGNSGFQTAIRHKGDLAGMIGMHGIQWTHRSSSIGYWLAKRLQGQGIMTRACSAYLRHCFGELGLHRMEIRCATDNERSRAIPERLGFTNEGTLRDAEWVTNRFVSHVVYGLLSKDWRKQ
ncbi:GNAT family N-acetyltransferase [Aeoliella mucimassa]|uniref:Ribosomal N-acetyltransferase YdaF n=1 Tax=Aeoliella mucimassa TaxID=2527972 RepID=A0A518ALW3_9BACT|nr:GNAT family protein [Aeoliella mucimassa]QDU55719.1 Putative ribosomal N-acetyltransferase YdaF [Aeoliella mucimassa]